MSDAALSFLHPADDADVTDVHLIPGGAAFEDAMAALPEAAQAWAARTGFSGAVGDARLLPLADGGAVAVVGYGTAEKRARADCVPFSRTFSSKPCTTSRTWRMSKRSLSMTAWFAVNPSRICCWKAARPCWSVTISRRPLRTNSSIAILRLPGA